MPTTLVGANVGGKPNYATIAYCGIVNSNPPLISVCLRRTRYTITGIKENGTFSVNIPSADMVEVTDYCGIVSGRKVDKSTLFETFYGKLETAPMIRECPLNMECKLIQTLEFATHDTLIGEIVEAYAEEQYLTDGVPDIKKIDPILYSTKDSNYWRVGEYLAQAFSVGEKLRYVNHNNLNRK
jgi:flavin reductase (DIM6/NTAB) family NADH-FMN oxidoreductase RutF